MKIFVSGATGFIGSRLVNELSARGHEVHALYRSELKTTSISSGNVTLFKGDILDSESIDKAMKGCDQVYHVAAFAKIWTRDPSSIYKLNIDGAVNVIRSGIRAGVKKMVITSTAGVFGPSGTEMVNEESQPGSYFIDYETSKYLLEKVIKTICLTGPEIVIVNPTRVYGPGLMNESNSVTKMIDGYRKGKWRLIPGSGASEGNYVFVDDVVKGHILAMEKGKSAESYILGGDNLSYNQFFSTLRKITGKKFFMIKVPLFLILFLSRVMVFFAEMFGINPFITPGLVKKFYHNYRVSSVKAKHEINYEPISFEKGAGLTIEWLEKVENIARTKISTARWPDKTPCR